MKEKIINFIKSNALLSCIICAFVVALLTSVIVAAVMIPDGESDVSAAESNEAKHKIEWGKGITDGVPEFSGEPVSVEGTDGYVAAYYENVRSEQIAEYISLVENELGIKFSSDKYPRSAVWGDKLIAIHYNVTEMKLSVTVVSESVQKD